MTVESAVEAAIAAVPDPEIRVLTIADLGILRGIEVAADGRVVVTITPTYTGCPAMDVIRRDIVAAATRAGAAGVEVRTELSPPWTTDWISADGRAKLAAAGTVPPPATAKPGATMLRLTMRCPRCGSPDTEELSRFGSTACKSLWRCRSCREPFDSVKAH
ncbi:1,2-phenylacetyl-CoA epoxidase subunit PaaD [Virgisporangium aurantiacum]|uniref:1,2-phenylacetyl-CoA epoxidase subunit PaaD n=1 Tax=Virgisporangium aurantiacum TaxID=175570 RepID=UPI001EF389C7|nr:1,2-phenylacetyl-CoA epoxidase subunit PaaD [Virgisporangium aurantiacum]